MPKNLLDSNLRNQFHKMKEPLTVTEACAEINAGIKTLCTIFPGLESWLIKCRTVRENARIQKDPFFRENYFRSCEKHPELVEVVAKIRKEFPEFIAENI